jgi:arylsulfatase A-like enzyme
MVSRTFAILVLVLMIQSREPVAAVIEAGSTDRGKQPNIVVFLVDDMGVMDTSVPFLADNRGKPKRYPLNDRYRTPNMMRLAGQGIRFEYFYANSVCSPTRVSLMTGQTSARHRTTQYINPNSNNAGKFGPVDWQWNGISKAIQSQTLPAILKKGGYRTIHAGKGHFGPVDSFGSRPENFGFDVNIAGCAWGRPGSYYGKDHFGHASRKGKSRAVPGLEKYHGQDIHLTEALTLEMNDAIRKSVEDGQPFFAYMSHYAVHGPFQLDQRFAENYSDAKLDNKATAFATMIEGMDKSLGDILDQLDDLGVANNTLVFFLGDNGTDAPLGPTHEVACAAPLRGKKGTHYEGGIRVPFIAAWAQPDSNIESQQRLNIPQGLLSANVGTIYDLFPTILGITGLETDALVDGVDLSTMLTGAPSDRTPTFLMHFPHDHRSDYYTAYRLGDWKLIYHYRNAENERFELYNLEKDRDESENLARQNRPQLKRMIKAMAAALFKADAQYPLSDQHQPLTPRMPPE